MDVVKFMGQIFSVFPPFARPLAYLDPGSGSFLIQLLIAGLLGAGFLIKTFWRRIVAFLTGKKQPAKENLPADDPTNPPEQTP